MSQSLDSLLTPEQRTECARHDAAMLDVFPEMVELQALETARMREATDAWHRRNDAQARALDQQHFDVLRRVGVL